MRKIILAVTATIILTAGTAFAAASMYRYELTKFFKVPITQAEAAQGLAWFNARGAWDGSPASEVKYCMITRTEVSDGFPDGLAAQCHSVDLTGTVPADMLPDGAKVVEVIH